MTDQQLQEADCRLRVARAIWLAMVNDEAPDDETLNREGYLDAADAVLGLLVPRSEADRLLAIIERQDGGGIPCACEFDDGGEVSVNCEYHRKMKGEAEALAEALEHPAHEVEPEACAQCRALAKYRAAHPKEETP